VLQSVPVLGFLTFTVVFFMGLFPGSQLGAELAEIAAAQGCELLQVEFQAGTLRLILDREGGVRLEDCETVSKLTSALLDVRNFGPGRYTLEVSSPGLDRQLYGPRDYTRRDSQFARVVPALVRLFPDELVQTVERLGELHALSEVLDTAMARQLLQGPVSALPYLRAWQAIGREADRGRQIELTLTIAERLDHLTKKPLLYRSLRMMRGPARSTNPSRGFSMTRMHCNSPRSRLATPPNCSSARRDCARCAVRSGRNCSTCCLVRSPLRTSLSLRSRLRSISNSGARWRQ